MIDKELDLINYPLTRKPLKKPCASQAEPTRVRPTLHHPPRADVLGSDGCAADCA